MLVGVSAGRPPTAWYNWPRLERPSGYPANWCLELAIASLLIHHAFDRHWFIVYLARILTSCHQSCSCFDMSSSHPLHPCDLHHHRDRHLHATSCICCCGELDAVHQHININRDQLHHSIPCSHDCHRIVDLRWCVVLLRHQLGDDQLV